MSTKVVLLKSESSSSDKYSEILESNKFDVSTIATLDFRFKNLELLGEKLECSNEFAGVVFTSPRSINATEMLNKDLSAWNQRSNYCVGETSYSLAKSLLNLETKGKDTGNANNLADFIRDDMKESTTKPFLFPCGNLKQDILSKKLSEYGFSLDCVEVYETIPHPDIERSLRQVSGNAEYFVYFSPSGVKFTIDILRKLEIDLEKIKFIAIGPSTQKALQEFNLKIHSVCDKPNPESLLKALL